MGVGGRDKWGMRRDYFTVHSTVIKQSNLDSSLVKAMIKKIRVNKISLVFNYSVL